MLDADWLHRYKNSWSRKLSSTDDETLDVEVQADHLERLARCRPSSAIAELIWNALDADAKNIAVTFTRNTLNGLEAIMITDDGKGIGGEGRAPNELFRQLGGSWKKDARRTKAGRVVHGQAGEGRFKAFALGERVTWTSRSLHNGSTMEFSISKSKSSRQFKRTQPKATRAPSGTSVLIENLRSTPAPDAPSVFGLLCQEFALYLRQYPGISIRFDEQSIDPRAMIARVDELSFDIEITDAERASGTLVIVEWAAPMDRALYLCDEDGFALHEVPPGIQARGFTFTAYVKAAYLRALKEQSLVDSDLIPGRERLLTEIKKTLRDHFRKRAAEQAQGAVEQWRAEQVYPYTREPATPVETVERQVFDICALNLSGYLPDFETSDPKQKRLTFRLLKQALEENPESLRTILGEVLGLPKEKQDDLAELLTQTSLSAIINASKVVGDRLNFLTGIADLVFDEDTKSRLLERSQLHRMLVPNTWLFGEEYNLTIDDESLESVLAKHLALLGRDTEEDSAPVLKPDGTKGVVDLMLSRSVPQPNALMREHLVVELKRPSQKITGKVLTQIKEYAHAVASDERFRDTGTRWRFIAVSSDMNDSARREANQRHRPPGLVYDDEKEPYTVWAFTWGQLFQQARARLEFFKKELNFNATRDSAKAHLKTVYEKYIPFEESAEKAEKDAKEGD